jgi:hypothetical protein
MSGPAIPAAVIASAGLLSLNEKTAAQAPTQETRPAQESQDPTVKKRKSVHEYGPEDLLPQAQETETSSPKRGPVAPAPGFIRPKAVPSAPAAVPPPLPVTTPVLTTTPVAISTPVVTSTPAQQSVTPAVPAPSVPATAASQKPAASVSNRSTLLLVSGLFAMAFLALVYFVFRFIRELRAENEDTAIEAPVSEPVRVRVDNPPAVVESIKRGEKPAKNMKNKMRKARYN